MRFAILLLFQKIKKIHMLKEEQREMRAMKMMMTQEEVKELLANSNEIYLFS
jgi:hypothetical protein